MKGDLTLTATRGDLILGAASRQQADGTLTATAGGALQALGSASAGKDLSLRAGADARLGGVIATKQASSRPTPRATSSSPPMAGCNPARRWPWTQAAR